jgi:hypothetical protein
MVFGNRPLSLTANAPLQELMGGIAPPYRTIEEFARRVTSEQASCYSWWHGLIFIARPADEFHRQYAPPVVV